MNNPLFNQLNNPMNLIQQLNSFKQSLNGGNPEMIVKNMLQSGRISQEQFDNASRMASQLQQMLKK